MCLPFQQPLPPPHCLYSFYELGDWDEAWLCWRLRPGQLSVALCSGCSGYAGLFPWFQEGEHDRQHRAQRLGVRSLGFLLASLSNDNCMDPDIGLCPTSLGEAWWGGAGTGGKIGWLVWWERPIRDRSMSTADSLLCP